MSSKLPTNKRASCVLLRPKGLGPPDHPHKGRNLSTRSRKSQVTFPPFEESTRVPGSRVLAIRINYGGGH